MKLAKLIEIRFTMIENVGNKNKKKHFMRKKMQSSKPLVCGELDLLCWKSQNQNQRPRLTMSVCHIFGFAATNTQVWKHPPSVSLSSGGTGQAKRKRGRHSLSSMQTGTGPLHVVTMQGAKHHMQVIFRDLRDSRRKTLIYGRGLRLGALAFCLWADRQIQTELRASRNIKSDLGGVWTRSGEDKICESAARMARREKIGPNNTHLHPKIIM